MWRPSRSLLSALCLLLCLIGCSPQSLFYYPNRQLYNEPERFKIAYEQVEYPSLNGKKLWAILMKTPEKPKGTVVHFHGNFGNLSDHFPLSTFFLKQGYDVLVFDYQGYGASEGKPTQKNTVEDGIASVRYAQAHLRDPATGVVVFGQSLGGAVGVVVTAKEPLVRAAVIESGFSSYSKMGREAMGRHWWSWPMVPVAFFLGGKYDPVKYVGDISPRPILFVHGDQDHTVQVHMSRDLYAAAKEPKKLWIIEGAGHLECRRVAGLLYEKTIVDFVTDALTGSAAR
jgi:fermentation-respiration switch protein FrsA (DUF1100 family)